MNIWRQESQVFHEVGWRACPFFLPSIQNPKIKNFYFDFAVKRTFWPLFLFFSCWGLGEYLQNFVIMRIITLFSLIARGLPPCALLYNLLCSF
jgi:hypothetical protein